MMLRRCRRAVALAWTLALCVLRYWRIRLRGPLSLERRAQWLQSASRGVLASLGISFRVDGALPGRGLAVSNHLGYLDIVIYSAAMPCFFVSKAEVDRWPFFGRAARAGGAIFLDRTSLASANLAASIITGRLALPVPVLLFPEGTSTDGSQVHRFHRRLLHPAIETGAPISPAAIRYLPQGGAEERDLCWYGDAGFLRHLWKVLGLPGFSARICFGDARVYADARVAADATHDEVAALRAQGSWPEPAALKRRGA